MKATSTDRVPTGSGWAAEIKWDGMRIEATIIGATDGHPPTMVLRSSNGRDVTGSFPELAGLAEALHADAVLDGEVVVFDGDRPSFARLQQRIHIDRPHPTLVEAHPVVYIVFDLLRLDGNLLIDLPYVTRRRLLNDLLPDGANWRTPPFIDDDPESLLELAAERDLEGIVVKRLDSVYEPGTRSSAWRKIKILRRQEFVVGGWLEGQRSLEKQLGSLMVGVWDDGRLVMAGRVGSGLTEVERSPARKTAGRDRRTALRRGAATRQTSRVGRADRGGRGRIRRVAPRRPAPASRLPRPADRPGSGGGHPGVGKPGPSQTGAWTGQPRQ